LEDEEDEEEESDVEEEDDGVQWDAPQDDVVDPSLPQSMGEDLDLSQWASGPFLYHVEGDGPSKPPDIGHSTLSGPSEPREGPKRHRADEERPRSGGLTPKHRHPVAPR
jgi:hypothetical protein